MYRVKLAEKVNGKKNVDCLVTPNGILITRSWTTIKEKTKELEELEKNGVIKIERITKITKRIRKEIAEKYDPLKIGQQLLKTTMAPLIERQELLKASMAPLMPVITPTIAIKNVGEELLKTVKMVVDSARINTATAMAEELLKTTGIASAITEARATMASTSFINSISFALEAEHMKTAGGIISAMAEEQMKTAGGMTSVIAEELMKTTRMLSLSEIPIESMKISHVIYSVGGLAAMGIKDVVSKAFFSRVETSQIISLSDTIQGLSESFDDYVFSSILSTLSESFRNIVEAVNSYQLSTQMNPLGEKLKEIGSELKINSFATVAIDSLSIIQKQIDSKTISVIEAQKKILTEFKTISIALDPGTALDKKDKKETERLKKDYICELETENKKVKIENEELMIENEELKRENENYSLILHEKDNIIATLRKTIKIQEKRLIAVKTSGRIQEPGNTENETDLFLWFRSVNHLEILYNELIDNRFLLKTITYSEFKSHFAIGRSKKKAKIGKLQWMETESRIVYLFDKLNVEQFLSKSIIYKKIEAHFLNKDGKNFKHNQLISTYYQNQKYEVKYQEIDKIIVKLKSIDCHKKTIY